MVQNREKLFTHQSFFGPQVETIDIDNMLHYRIGDGGEEVSHFLV